MLVIPNPTGVKMIKITLNTKTISSSKAQTDTFCNFKHRKQHQKQ
jgi:hypothetical protein